MKRKRYNCDFKKAREIIKQTRKHVNLISLSLSLACDTLCFRVKHKGDLKQRERWPSRASWIASGRSMSCLMERCCVTQWIWILPLTFHGANLLSQSTERQKTSSSSFHFWYPGRQRSRCLIRSLLHWVEIDEVLAGIGMGVWGEVRVNTLFKLWTLYFWLTSQFSTVQYTYLANLKCMAAQ